MILIHPAELPDSGQPEEESRREGAAHQDPPPVARSAESLHELSPPRRRPAEGEDAPGKARHAEQGDEGLHDHDIPAPVAQRAEGHHHVPEVIGGADHHPRLRNGEGHSPSDRTARKASWGISTEPTCFIRRFPSFCFSRSFRFRLMSPP